ncbi:hypothetical protein AB0393_29100 [Streptomyces cyaneofuscatus]|uniref:hypothetical protein n=1 Tax=Streptomyces cyaneofuscatus TaxID=66883 RepID=UPI00344B1856
MSRDDPYKLPETSAMALRAALDGVRHARDTARTVALATLADAARGHIRQYNGQPGTLHAVMTSSLGTAKIIPDSLGGLTTLDVRVSPAAYDRIRKLLEEDCRHDDACDCEPDPWPALDALPHDEQVSIWHLDGVERGTAKRSPFGRGDVSLDLHEEDVFKAAEALRIALALAPYTEADRTRGTPPA